MRKLPLAKLLVCLVLLAWALAESNFPYLGTDTSKANIPLEQILSAGPPPQGIPALGFSGLAAGQLSPTNPPRFVPLSQANWLAPDEPVLVYGERAYPLRILLWHEIVNDNPGIPLAVSYCPLSGSTVVFDRRVALSEAQRQVVLKHNPQAKIAPADAAFRSAYQKQTGQQAPPWVLEVSFGTSGMLYNSNLLMFDSGTGSVFAQLTGLGSVGTLTDTLLLRYPAQVVSASEFARAYPAGQVLSPDTGFNRPYEQNPYLGYDQPEQASFLLPASDKRVPPKERVVALQLGNQSLAYRFSALSARRVLDDRVNGQDITLWWAPGSRSVLDASSLARAKDVGAVGVFSRSLEGRLLSFSWDGKGFVDQETKSRWNLLGQASEGPLKGKRLEPILHDTPFWFAWAAFWPNTQLRP